MCCGPTKETAHQHKTADKHVLIGRLCSYFFMENLKCVSESNDSPAFNKVEGNSA